MQGSGSGYLERAIEPSSLLYNHKKYQSVNFRKKVKFFKSTSRYRMMPLWNLLFWEAHKTGTPPMRPIWYNYPKATDTYGIENAFMLGDSILVTPAMEAGIESVEAFFPGGAQWFR